jgi:uncharacterized protein
MVVTVDQIREGGLSLDEPLSEAFLTHTLADVKDTGFRPQSAATLHVKFRKTASGVVVQGSTEVAVHTACRRCLADVPLQIPLSFTLNLVSARSLAAGEAGEGDDEHSERAGSFELTTGADEDVFDGRTIDLDPLVREQVLLALPMHAQCSEDCKGLCGSCGQNLNEGRCACRTDPVDARLAGLKNIKLN